MQKPVGDITRQTDEGSRKMERRQTDRRTEGVADRRTCPLAI